MNDIQGKILVIDDEKNFCDFIKRWLNQEGYEVIIATNGQEGVEKTKLYNPDLVLCDIRMPKKDGYSVLREIRNISSRYIPVIIVSVIDNFDKIHKAYDDEADFYLSKPVEFATLLKNIRILINLYKDKRKEDGV